MLLLDFKNRNLSRDLLDSIYWWGESNKPAYDVATEPITDVQSLDRQYVEADWLEASVLQLRLRGMFAWSTAVNTTPYLWQQNHYPFVCFHDFRACLA